MRFRIWLLIGLVAALAVGAGIGVRHLVGYLRDTTGGRRSTATAASVAPASQAAPVASPVAAPVASSSQVAASSQVAEAAPPPRCVVGVAWGQSRALVQWSDGEIYSSEDAQIEGRTLRITRTSVYLDGVRWPILPQPPRETVPAAAVAAQAAPAVAATAAVAAAAPQAADCPPDWEDRAGVLYLRDRSGLTTR